MKRLLLFLVAACALSAQAQLRIDINNSGRNPAEGTETTYNAWTFGRVPSAEGRFADVNGDSIIITISSVQGEGNANQPNAVRTNYWKHGVVDLFYKLLADDCTPGYMSGNGNDFDEMTTANGFTRGGLQIVVEGLSAGEHSLLTYHNTSSDYGGELAPVDVIVDGKTVSTGNKQTSRATKTSESGYSYITFTAEAGKPVTIQYISNPVADVNYQYVGVAINAFVFDEPNPATMAVDPIPTNLDMHVDADDGTTRLCWKSAYLGVKHHVMVGISPEAVSEVAVVTDTTYVLNDLYSLNTYYWRIDEEDAEGNVYTGETWSFQPRHLAFPGAEGYGRYASGGRGGDVYHVTSLADERNATPGTLRYGLETATGPRTIVFDVAGVITLQSRLTVTASNITIAGQTAPGRGIMLRSKPFGMSKEGITRFIRMRLGGADDWTDDTQPNPNTADGMGMTGNNHSIMDHCSISWTIDEAFSSRNAKNMTLQRTLISEALNYAGHATQFDRQGHAVQHGYAATIGGETGSYHHNLLAHNAGRNWSMGGGLDGAGILAGKLDMFNNICYNWYSRTTDGGTHEAQFVNNYYKMGPDTKLSTLFSMDHEGVGTGTQRAYVNGNIRENKNGSKSEDRLNDTYRYTGTVDYNTFVNDRFFESYATIHPAEEAFKNVLSDVGCFSPELDNHDIRMIQETLNGTTSTTGHWTKLRGVIDRESDAEGFQGLNIYEVTRPSDWDTDQDGMPDWWEMLTGSDKNTADNNNDPDKDGYTLLEDYLNWLAQPFRIIGTNSEMTIVLNSLFAGFTNNPSYESTLVSGTASASIADGVLTIKTGSEGLTAFDVTVTDGEGTKMTRRLNIAATDVETTGITTVRSKELPKDHAIYTLDGHRVKTPVKGVNIINGKKRIVR